MNSMDDLVESFAQLQTNDNTVNVETAYLANFTKIYSKSISLHKKILPEKLIVMIGDSHTLYIMDRDDITGSIPRYLQDPMTIYKDNILHFYKYHHYTLVYPYTVYKTPDEIDNEQYRYIVSPNYFKEDRYKRSNYIIYLKQDGEEYTMLTYVNNNVIDNIILNKRENVYSLNELIKRELSDKILKGMTDELDNIKNQKIQFTGMATLDNEELFLKDNIHLYHYQRADIDWMLTLHNDIANDTNIISFKKKNTYKILDDKFIMISGHILNTKLFPDIPEEHTYTNATLKFYGGNLISEVGLGKTITTLYYIFETGLEKRSVYSSFVDFYDKCNYVFKRGKVKGKPCVKTTSNENSLFCNEHSNTLFVDRRVLVYKNMDSFNLNSFINSNGFINTNASLVICPNHLCDQWVHEYYSKFKNIHRVVMIVTLDEWNTLSLGDILFADVVIISYSILYKIIYGRRNNISGIIKKHKNEENNAIDWESVLKSTSFGGLNIFNWNNVILDEAHELENIPRKNIIENTILNLQKNTIWNITGTPFPDEILSFFNRLYYTTNLHYRKESIFSEGLDKELVKASRQLFRRNRKLEIRQEVSENIINEIVHKLTFTQQEKNIYTSHLQSGVLKYSLLTKLCCDCELYSEIKTLIKNCKTFDEIQTLMLNLHKHKMNSCEKHISDLINIIKEKEESNNNDDDHLQSLGHLKRKLTLEQTKLSNHTRTYNYLKNVLDNIPVEEDISCPICLENIEKSKLIITKCGHKFCMDCITVLFKNTKYINCPSCKGEISDKDFYLLMESQANNLSENEDDTLEKIIHNVKSTKIGSIIHYLKNELLDGDKVIIFSQWDELLAKVGRHLTDYKIKIVFCDGTVYARKRAISSFQKSKDHNIIMLSSKYAASGINLTAANKIILLEPVYGSKEYRQNIETQAIGRADRIGQMRPIEVHRFIISDTIEEDIINENIDEQILMRLTAA